MSKRTQLAHWKSLFEAGEKRDKEISSVLSELGERIYIFNVLEFAERAIKDLYDLDDSDWNDEIIFEYLAGYLDVETFETFSVKTGGSYDGLRVQSFGGNVKYWREPFLVAGESGTLLN